MNFISQKRIIPKTGEINTKLPFSHYNQTLCRFGSMNPVNLHSKTRWHLF